MVYVLFVVAALFCVCGAIPTNLCVIEKDIPTVFQPAISSFCSCLSSHQSTATSTLTVSVTVTGTITDSVTNTVSNTLTDTVTATDTDTATETDTITDTITASASTVTNTVTNTATVTVTTSTASSVSVDQNGCPTVDGDSIMGYIIHCNANAGSESFAAGTNPGYNIEDCSSQCNDNPDNIDCLGATYTPPSEGAFSIIDGHLQPGTCTFYEFVSEPIAAPGVALAVFENSFSGRRVR